MTVLELMTAGANGDIQAYEECARHIVSAYLASGRNMAKVMRCISR